MSFTNEELVYLRSQPLARLATVAADGQPDVVPLAFEFNGTYFWVGGSGSTVLDTRKFRNVLADNREVALVIDDMVSFEPFVARDPSLWPCRGPGRARGHGRSRHLHEDHADGLLELEHGRRASWGHLVRGATNGSPRTLSGSPFYDRD